MHVYLAAARPQCRSTTMAVTNQDDAWGKDHAINCGVCGSRVIAAGLTGRGLQWHGSIDPEVWGNKLWDFASEGVDSFPMAEGDRRSEESQVVAAAAVVHYALGDSPLCGLEESPEPITPDPELVRGCGDCLELVAEDLSDQTHTWAAASTAIGKSMPRAESPGVGRSGTPARTAANRGGEAMMIPVTYGYARVSKSDRDDRNLETQLRELANHGIREELIFSDVMTGRLMSRPGWNDLVARVQQNDTIVVVWLDRFSRNFDEGVRIQADLTSRNIGIVAIKEGIDTTDDGAAAKYFRRMMMANGAYQADSTSERIKVGQERAKAEGRPPGRPPALSPDQVNECKRMFAENPSVSRVARIMKISWSTANRAIFDESSAQAGMQ